MRKEIIIWGAGHFGVLTALDLEKKGIKIRGFIDKDASNIKTRLKLPVFAPNRALFNKDAKIIIAVQDNEYIEEITKTLRQYGLKNNKDFKVSHLVPKKNPIMPTVNVNNLTSYNNDCKKGNKNPLVRVCVVTYNHIEFIGQCLNGILMQKTDFPFEIIIYDDCSTDGTSDIIREYAKKYSNIIADIQTENYYSKDRLLWDKKKTYNLKNHDCKYVAFVNGDDYWIDPYKLQYQINFLQNNSDFTMCSGGYLVNNNFSGEQTVALQMANLASSVNLEYDFRRERCLATEQWNNCALNSTRVYRTSAIPGYEIVKKYRNWIDVSIEYYALKKGRGYYFSRIFSVYNKHGAGMAGKLSSEQNIEFTYNFYEELYRITRDEDVKMLFTDFISKYAHHCLKSNNSILAFYKKNMNSYPELSKEFKGIWELKKFVAQNVEQALEGIYK